MITGCLIAIACALLLVVIIAVLKENHELQKAIRTIENSRQNLLVQVKLNAETIARGEALNQSLKTRIFELKEQLERKS